VAYIGKMRNSYRILVGKSGGKETTQRWENNIRMDFTEIRFESMDWMHLAQGKNR
jgi:hypothetical protein